MMKSFITYPVFYSPWKKYASSKTE